MKVVAQTLVRSFWENMLNNTQQLIAIGPVWRIVIACLVCITSGAVLSAPWLRSLGLEWQLLTAFLSPENQWMAVVALSGIMFYIGLFFVRWFVLHLLLFGVLLIQYSLSYGDSSQTTEALGLMSGVVLSALIAIVTSGEDERLTGLLLGTVPVLIGICAILPSDPAMRQYLYWGAARATGIWKTPNIFGLLMAIAIVVALGIAKVGWYNSKPKPGILVTCIVALAGLFLAHALVSSFSRGAWLGALVGGCYLLFYWYRRKLFSYSRRIELACAGLVIAMSIVVCAVWLCRSAETPLLRRFGSITNPYDLSVANRITAYESGIKLIAIRPVSGFGWTDAIRHYDMHFPDNLKGEGAAINTNSYLKLAIKVGVVPVLILVILIAKCFAHSRGSGLGLRTAARGGLVVASVGFWFNPGLSTGALAVVFWTLIGLGYQPMTSGSSATHDSVPLQAFD